MDRTDVDVLVVGSGPAGSTTARYAAMGGASVMFIERRPEVGVPVRCGEFMPSLEEIVGMFPNFRDDDGLFDIPQELRCTLIPFIRIKRTCLQNDFAQCGTCIGRSGEWDT